MNLCKNPVLVPNTVNADSSDDATSSEEDKPETSTQQNPETPEKKEKPRAKRHIKTLEEFTELYGSYRSA